VRLRPTPRPFVLAALAALAIALLAPAAGLAPVAEVAAADTDLTLVTDAVYDVRPAQGYVRVAMTIVARNHRGETRTHNYYFERAYLAVLPGTSGFRVTGAKGASVAVARKTKTYTLLRIDLGSRLYSGKARTLHLAFNLKDPGGAANRQVRVGSSLVSLPVWAFASDGASGSRVRVVFPAGYAVTVESGDFSKREKTQAGGTLLSTGSLVRPLSFFAYVIAQQPATYADTALRVPTDDGPVDLTMRAWKDDAPWAKRVGGLFAKSLPVLRRDIGIPWPHADPLVVQEAISRTTDGYAGLFDPAEGRIEVAYWANHLVAFHEAAHAWFNGGLLADRWAAEGFASYYAGRAAAALKEKAAAPRLTDALAKVRVPLNAWGQGGPGADATAEAYGYAASLELAKAIAERAGDEALRGVWADASARVGAYQPPSAPAEASPAGEPETVDAPPDWRGMLDLLEARTGGDFSDLWRTWVVRPEEQRLLDERAAARASYARTLALAGGWELPRSIRDALRVWRFDTAEALMADARTALAQRTAVEARAARNLLTVPERMRTLFEAGSMVEASTEAGGELAAIEVIEGAAGQQAVEPDALARIGLLGSTPEAELAASRIAYEAGDLTGAVQAASLAADGWSGAWQEGRRRALLAIAVLATLLVVVSAARSARRRLLGSRAGARA
jgi:hypothetical protein